MKTSILQRATVLMTTLLAVMFLTSACGPKQTTKVRPSNGPGPVGNPYTPSIPGVDPGACPGCGGETLLLRTTSAYDSMQVPKALEMNLDLVGQAGGNYNFNDPKIPVYYNGPIRGIGEIRVNATVWRLCNAAPGRYVIGSPGNESGAWQMTVARNLRLVGQNGNHRIIVRVHEGIPYHPQTISKDQVNRLGGTLVIESVNGQPCGEGLQIY